MPRQAAAQEKQQAKAQKGKKGNEEKPEETFAPQPIPDRQKKMIEAFDTYIKYVPGLDGAADHQVPQGAHLLRVQPHRRGDPAVQGHRRSPAQDSDLADLLGQPPARLPRRSRRTTSELEDDARSSSAPMHELTKDADFEGAVLDAEGRAQPSSASSSCEKDKQVQGGRRAVHQARAGLPGRSEDRRGLLQRRRLLREGQADRLWRSRRASSSSS